MSCALTRAGVAMQIRLDVCACAFLLIAPVAARSEDAAVADAAARISPTGSRRR